MAAVFLRGGDAEPAAFGERVVKLRRELVLLVLGHPVVVVELACQFGHRSADRLLVVTQLEVHDALHSRLGVFDLRTNHTNGQTKKEDRVLLLSSTTDRHAMAGSNGSMSAMRSFQA